ncbi:hypothetical protein Pst134EB_003623 [Puccinia striiformis f. sp. tritici]|nr:hypothetical protein Pst134EB_003623 [Puccinia striiformis f. sp. tritici]
MDDSILVVPTTTKGVLPDLIVDLNAKELKRKHSNNSLLLESLESTIDNHHHHHHQHQSTSSPPNEHQSKKLTTEKRKAQNRAAQRNFRERKEKQCKANEENLVIRTEENKKMRDLIECLEAENKFLRQHVNQTILDELAKIIPNSKNRVELSNVVIPIPPYDEFLSPDKPTQPNNHSNNNSNGTILSESEEHTRAATALSSLATGTPAIIDPVFDPQLAHLAGPSHQSNPSTIQAGTGDLIVPCSSASPSGSSPSTDSELVAITAAPPAAFSSSSADSNHHLHHHHHHHHQLTLLGHHHHHQFDHHHHQNLLHEKLFVDNLNHE